MKPLSRHRPLRASRPFQRLLDWQPHKLAIWQRLLVAVVITLLAAWLRMALAPAESGGRFITLSLAAALSTLYGGLWAGLLSTVLGMVIVNFFMVQPYFSFAFADPVEAFWLNLWHLITQAVVVGAIWRMQRQNLQLREASELVQNSQQRFLDTFEYAAAGITHVALDGRLIQANETFSRLVGYSAEELLRMRFQDFTLPEDIGPDEKMLQQTLAGERNSYSLEKRYVHKNGHPVWAHLTVALMRKANGLPDYFISVVQDISSLKNAESALRTSERLMRQAQNLAGFASWEGDLASNQFRALGGSHVRLGLPKAEFRGEDLQNMVHPKEQERFLRDWVLALQGATYNGTYRARMEGKDRWFSVRAEFERDADGRAVRAFGVTQDISDRKRAEMEIRRLNVSLEQRIQERTRELKGAYDELESYSYAVAHDLRSPLRVINGFAQALGEDNPVLDGASRKHLERIMGASKKMGLLIDGLLQIAQIGRGELNCQDLNLSAMASHLLEELAGQSPERTVAWDVQPGLHAFGDASLIEALLQNLLHNAWKYTSATAQPLIRVFAREAGHETVFCVSDNGAGFDMARADKLFQPFQRLHQPHEFTGLGIGLATAQRIVQRHGGVMQAEAAPGQGATFSFTLPAEASDSLPSLPQG